MTNGSTPSSPDGPDHTTALLDERLRGLAADTDRLALDNPGAVRRRGDRRRRATQTGAILGIAALAVVGVGVASTVSQRPQSAPPAGSTSTPAPSESPSALTLAKDPFLRGGDVAPIGPYQTFTETDSLPATRAFLLECLPPPSDLGAVNVLRQSYTSDLDATFNQSVLSFDSPESAAQALDALACVMNSRTPEESATQKWQTGTPNADINQVRIGRLTIPDFDADYGYQEIAAMRQGSAVVILDWSSMGVPHGEDMSKVDNWEWAWSDEQLVAAMDQAIV